MQVVKRDVDELNELAKKITGVNPSAKTTAQALNYIEQNYTSGGSSTGGGILYLSTEYDETADNFYLKDITKDDIKQAISDSKIIILHYTEEGLETDDMLYYFGGYNEGLNGIFFYNGSQMQTYLKDSEGVYYLDNL